MSDDRPVVHVLTTKTATRVLTADDQGQHGIVSCGACGADAAEDTDACHVCGAEFVSELYQAYPFGGSDF